MVAKGGTKLISNQAIKILKRDFLHQVSLITPNIPEAEVLTGLKINNKTDMIKVGEKLISLGAKKCLNKRWTFKIKKS